MQRHWEQLARLDREGFTVVVEKSWEDAHPGDLFDDSVYDIEDICRQIDRGDLDWFMLRVRCVFDKYVLGEAHLGGMLYEDSKDVLTDGMIDDIIWEALNEAKSEARKLGRKLFLLTIANSHTQEA